MILVDISLSPSDTLKYSVKVNGTHIPIGETPFSSKALYEIILLLNNETITLPYNISNDNYFHFFLSYHENAKLTSKISENIPKEMFLSQDDLAQEIIGRTKNAGDDNNQKDCVGRRYPILHVSAANMLSGDKRIVHNIRYFNIMDSSIWNYYISFQELYSSGGIAHLCYIFEQMIRNQVEQLYELRISTEYADLNARLIQSDYTDPIGHGSSVTPFLFHSEWKMKKMHEKFLADNPRIIKQRWRFLLLDDYVMDSLRQHSGEDLSFIIENGQIIRTSKLAIVKRAIEDIPGFTVSWRYYCNGQFLAQSNKELEEDSRVQVWCAKSISDALSLLKIYKFDIILLDYLLGEHSVIYESINNEAINQRLSEADIDNMLKSWEKDMHSSSREYGFQLLKRLKFFLSTESSYQGPVGRQFFMFISAFTTAVDERLRAEGLNRSEEYWQIGEGACPTNTPELFKFRLLQLMDGRLKQTCIQDLSYDSIIKEVEGIFSPELKQMHLIRKLDYKLRQTPINNLSCNNKIITEIVKDVFEPIPKDIPLLNDLSKRINQQIDNDELSYANIIKEIETVFAPDIKEKEKRIESVRKRAYKAYKTILGYHYDYFTLKMDEGRSLLVDSFLSDKDHMDALLEHLLQFVHLTAFGTVRQWHDIWEEYQYFVRTLGSSVSADEIRDISGYIEQHIIDLKSN